MMDKLCEKVVFIELFKSLLCEHLHNFSASKQSYRFQVKNALTHSNQLINYLT